MCTVLAAADGTRLGFPRTIAHATLEPVLSETIVVGNQLGSF